MMDRDFKRMTSFLVEIGIEVGQLFPEFLVGAALGEGRGIVSHHRLVLFLRDFVDGQVERPREHDFVLGRFALDALLPNYVVGIEMFERLLDLGRSAAHRELTRRDKDKLHADAIGVFQWQLQVVGPVLLVLSRLFFVEGSDGRRRGGQPLR